MCWSVPVTTLFLLGHLAAAQIVHRVPTRYRTVFLWFIYFYAGMELLQLSQWTTGVRAGTGTGTVGSNSDFCTSINKTLTFVAYALIWLQPLLFSVIGLRVVGGDYYRYSFYLSVSACLTAFINTLMSWMGDSHVTVLNTATNFGGQMCTSVGKYGHLLWQFPIYTLDIHPSYFVYVAIILLCIARYPRALQYTMGAGWFVTLLVSMYLVRGSGEIPSFWCLLSVFADIPIVMYTLYSTKALRGKVTA